MRPRLRDQRAHHPTHTLDVDRVRSHFDFPDLGRVVTNNAASTQPPRELAALLTRLTKGYENVHRGQSVASQQMTELFEACLRHVRAVAQCAEPAQHRDVPQHDRGHQRGDVLAAHRLP